MYIWLTVISIIAILLSPLIALTIQEKIRLRSERKSRKAGIFYVLMVTRANKLSYEHVEALNSIEIEYHETGKKGKKVLDAWHEYLYHFKKTNIPDEQWCLEQNKIFYNLLFGMSNFLGNKYTKTQIEDHIYAPQGHNENDKRKKIIDQGLADILSGKSPLSVSIIEKEEKKEEEFNS